MIAVLKHELSGCFHSLTAYIFGAFLLVFVGVGAMIYNIQQAVANFEYVLSFVSLAFVVLVPVLTMRVIAEERKQKTDQLLYSLPITAAQIVVGKYLALLVVYLLPLCAISVYPLIFARFGEVYLITSYGSIAAFFVMGAALIAAGMFISSLTENQGFAAGIAIVAILLNYYSVSLAEHVSATAFGSAAALCVLCFLFGAVIRFLTKNEKLAYTVSGVMILAVCITYIADSAVFEGLLPDIMTKLSLFERFNTIVSGVFDLTAVVYYPLDRFAVEISELIRHDEIPGFEEVTQVQFTGAESDRIIYEEDSTETYSGEDVYFMERGERRLALDTARVEDYLNTVKNLGLKEYVTYNASEEEIEEYGMDVPELSIQLDYTVTEEGSDEKTSGTFSLQIGRDPKEREKEKQNTGSKDNESGDDEIKDSEEDQTEEEDVKAYARVGESKIIYQITGQQFKKLMDISYNTLRHQEMFWRDFEDMYRLDIQLEGETCTITSELEEEKRVYYYGGEEVEMAGIRAGISGLRATGFTAEEPAQKEEIGLTIYLDNENHSEVTIQLYRYDGNKCIAVVDKESVAFVERTEVIDLVEAVHTIILDQNGAGTEGG